MTLSSPRDMAGASPAPLRENVGKKTERGLQAALGSCRWLLAPFFLGLALCLVALLVQAAMHVFHIMQTVFTATESAVVMDTLSMIDLTFCAALVVLVIFSVYENFVSRIELASDSEWPEWMGAISFNGLKLKLMASIVAIGAIWTLRALLDSQNYSDRDLAWSVGGLLAFVVCALLLAWMDRISSHEDKH
jgi:uncharacterized protein (TIGR00645 family)